MTFLTLGSPVLSLWPGFETLSYISSKLYYPNILTFCRVCAYFSILFTLIQNCDVTPPAVDNFFFQCLWRHWPFYLPSCFKQWRSGGSHKMNKCSSMYSSTRLFKHIVMPSFPVYLTMGMVIYFYTIYFHWSLLPLTSYLLSFLLCADCLSSFLIEYFILYKLFFLNKRYKCL